MTCRRCNQPIVEVRPGHYGHVENPRQNHHYATPVRTIRSGLDAGTPSAAQPRAGRLTEPSRTA